MSRLTGDLESANDPASSSPRRAMRFRGRSRVMDPWIEQESAGCAFAESGVAYVKLRTFVLLPREVRVVLNDQGLFSPDHLKSLLSWVLVLKFFLSR